MLFGAISWKKGNLKPNDYIQEMTLMGSMWQEKKEEDDSQRLKTSWMKQNKNSKNI